MCDAKVFDGYVLVKRDFSQDQPYYERQNECPLIYTNNMHPEYKHVVVDVAGCDSVRFNARISTSQAGTSQVPYYGWAFYDESNYDYGQYLSDNTGFVQYSPFDFGSEVSLKEYIVSVPEGAKYMKISYLTQTELNNAYIYLRHGHAVLGDSVNKNRHVVKNLLDYSNFIRGSYIVGSNGWIQGSNPEAENYNEYAIYGIMSNKLYLEDGQTYTISNVAIHTDSATIRIIRFNSDDEYMTYFSVPAIKDYGLGPSAESVWKHYGHGTFTYKNKGDSYVRVVIRVNVEYGDNGGLHPELIPHAQLEIGSQVTAFAKFNEVEDYDLASGQFERKAGQQLKVVDYEDIEEGSFKQIDLLGPDNTNYGVSDYKRGEDPWVENGHLRVTWRTGGIMCKVYKVNPGDVLYFSCDVAVPDQNTCNYALMFVGGVWENNQLLGKINYQNSGGEYTAPVGITFIKRRYQITTITVGPVKYTHNRFVVPDGCNAIIMNAYNNSFKVQKQIEVDSSLQEVYDYIEQASQGKSEKHTINILSIGNSGSQDSLAYVPFLMKHIAPDVNINIGIAMLSSSANANHVNNFNYFNTPYDENDSTGFHYENTIGQPDPIYQTVKMYNNGKSYTYFHCSSFEENWTQEAGLKAIQEIVELEKWDVILFNSSYTNPGKDGQPTDNTTEYDNLNYLSDGIMQVVKYPVRFGIISPETSVAKNGKFYTGDGDTENGRPYGKYDTGDDSLKQRGLRRSINGKRIIEGWDLTYIVDGVEEHASGYDGITHETMCDFMLPVNTAIENALTVQTFRNMGDFSKHVNNFNYIDESDYSLGKEGYLRAPDGVHLQEGLPCQIAAYTVICKILEMSDMPYKSILGDSSVCDSDWTRGRSIPGPHPDISSGPSYTKNFTEVDVPANAHTGWVTPQEAGGEEEALAINLARARFAQKCAVMACKHPYQITDMNQYW